MEDLSRYTIQYRLCGQFSCDLSCSEVLSDICDEEALEYQNLEETLDGQSLGDGHQDCQIYDCSAFANKTHVADDEEGLAEFPEDLLLDFSNPCSSSALASDVDLENQNEFIRYLHATLSDDLDSWSREFFNESITLDFEEQEDNTFTRCEDNAEELNNSRQSFTDSQCSTLHLQFETPTESQYSTLLLQLETPDSLLTHIIHDHNYSTYNSSSPRERSQSVEDTFPSDDEDDQLVPSSQSNQNVYNERVISSCIGHGVPHMYIEE